MAAHGQRMEERVLRHREEGKALLLREEAQLEQGRGDLLELSRQLEELLRRRDRLEVSKLLGPLASRLDRIGGELRTTGQVVCSNVKKCQKFQMKFLQAIIHKLQFVPLLLPESQVYNNPNGLLLVCLFVSSARAAPTFRFSVSQTQSVTSIT